MQTQKYSVYQNLIETLLVYLKSGEINIPEIQLLFVWDASKVRDLMDSLYQGDKFGNVTTWCSPNVRFSAKNITKKLINNTSNRFLK
jgi:hypothetical protein